MCLMDNKKEISMSKFIDQLVKLATSEESGTTIADVFSNQDAHEQHKAIIDLLHVMRDNVSGNFAEAIEAVENIPFEQSYVVYVTVNGRYEVQVKAHSEEDANFIVEQMSLEDIVNGADPAIEDITDSGDTSIEADDSLTSVVDW